MKHKEPKKRKFSAYKLMRGSISILLSVVLTGVLSLGTMLVEAARYQEAKQQLEENSLVSALSILANYDTDMESRFGLYGVNSETLDANTFLNYMTYNSDVADEGSANLLSRPYTLTSAKQELRYDLANYMVLERQILEYEKYRGPLNVAEELLDIDKMIKELKENIAKLIPGLEEMLTICNSVADLAEALKALYGLYKDVQQLQLTIGYEGVSVDKAINSVLGKGWETVETWLSGEEWPSHDPTYAEAYKALENAVNKKVNYMKNNPKPPDPGPKPNVDVVGLKAQSDRAYTKYKDLELLLELLECAQELAYCNKEGIVNGDSSISDMADEDISDSDLLKLGLKSSSSRKQLMNKLNSEIQRLVGSAAGVSEWKSSTLKTAISNVSGALNSAINDYNNKYSAYSVANTQMSQWQAKKDALDKYNQDIEDLTKAINSAKADLVEVIGVIEKELKAYKSSLNSVVSAMQKAKDALKNIKEMQNKEEDKDKASDIFDEVMSRILEEEIEKPDKGLAFLKGQKEELNKLKGKNVDASYVFTKHFNKGKMFDEGVYFMTKKQATGFCASLAALNVMQEMADILNIVKALWGLVKALQPFPYTYEWDCVVDLKASTTNILPSRINGGLGSTEAPHSSDIQAIEGMLDDARNTLDGKYLSEINSVSPNDRIATGNDITKLTDAITRLCDNLSKLIDHGAVASVMGTVWTFVYLIIKIHEIIPLVIQIIEDVILIANNIETALSIMVNSLGDNLLLSLYAIEKFPNRTTDTGNKQNEEISGYKGDIRSYTPDESKEAQTFSGACVEYIIGGDYSEEDNQRKVFWTIFVIRALNNAVLVAADPDAMNIISACNFVAPLVYILWVYLESNIDMNLLIDRKEVPLIKKNLIISKKTLTEAGDKLKKAFEDMDQEADMKQELSHASMKIDYATAALLTPDGIFKMKYQDYLWFYLLLIPNKTKVMRMADLIQMEMRFAKFGPSMKFELKNLHTYVRCEATATFNPILPVIPLGSSTSSMDELQITAVKYVGY